MGLNYLLRDSALSELVMEKALMLEIEGFVFLWLKNCLLF
jgi:hypothetical protein